MNALTYALISGLPNQAQIRQQQQDMSNIAYNDNLMSFMKPLPRMLDDEGNLSQTNLGNIKLPPDLNTYYENVKSMFPEGTPLDLEKINNDYQQMTQANSLQLDQNLAQARMTTSDKDIAKSLEKSNPALLDYYISTQQLMPAGPGGPSSTAVDIGTGLATYGLSSLLQTPNASRVADSLEDLGLKFKNNRLSKITIDDIMPKDMPRNKNIGPTKDKGIQDLNKIAREKAKADAKKTLSKMTANRKALGTMRNKAINQALKTGAGKAATNIGLRAVAPGLLGRGLAALVGGPVGLGITVGSLAPMIYDAVRGE